MPKATSPPLAPVRRQSWLLAVTFAPWNYPLSFVVDTTFALTLLIWSVSRIERPGAAVLVVLCGVVSWTLVEYAFHRFLFHGSKSPRSFREGHGRHHVAPMDRLALPFFVPPLVGLAFLGAASAVLGVNLGVLFTGVNAAGYVAYGSVHHLVHSGAQVPPLPSLRAVHEVHHRRPNRNYGVTTPLWDVILGTWLRPQRG
jgi:sterol desaturase/sphingolipid hydroxylase (fatty acid hydroxylase superfamily)